MLAPVDTTPAPVAAKSSLVGLTRGEIAAALGAVGVPEREQRMRTAQIWHWIYHRGATSFDTMTNMGKALRAALDAAHTLARPEIVTEPGNA